MHYHFHHHTRPPTLFSYTHTHTHTHTHRHTHTQRYMHIAPPPLSCIVSSSQTDAVGLDQVLDGLVEKRKFEAERDQRRRYGALLSPCSHTCTHIHKQAHTNTYVCVTCLLFAWGRPAHARRTSAVHVQRHLCASYPSTHSYAFPPFSLSLCLCARQGSAGAQADRARAEPRQCDAAHPGAGGQCASS
jgi:hypothetical protein